MGDSNKRVRLFYELASEVVGKTAPPVRSLLNRQHSTRSPSALRRQEPS